MTNAPVCETGAPTTDYRTDRPFLCTPSSPPTATKIAERRIAARFGLTLSVARVVVEHAGLGGSGDRTTAGRAA
jgi:hypothetical protein